MAATVAGAAARTQWRLRVLIAVQIGVPATLLAWRVVTGHLPFGGWAWGMYAG